MAQFAKLIPIIVTSLTGILAIVNPQIQEFLLKYPSVSIALGGLYTILTTILPSPISKK